MCTTLRYTVQLCNVQHSALCNTLNCATLYDTVFLYDTIYCTTLQYTAKLTLPYTVLHCLYNAQQCTPLHCSSPLSLCWLCRRLVSSGRCLHRRCRRRRHRRRRRARRHVPPHARRMRVRRVQRPLRSLRGTRARWTGAGCCAGMGHEWALRWRGASGAWCRWAGPRPRCDTFVSL